MCTLRPETCDLRCETCDVRPETCDLNLFSASSIGREALTENAERLNLVNLSEA